jgi:hypothetical protein
MRRPETEIRRNKSVRASKPLQIESEREKGFFFVEVFFVIAASVKV